MNRIKRALKLKGKSQSWLSQIARIPQSNMNLIANDKQIPCPAWKKRISEALQLPEDFLFAENVKGDPYD